MAKHRTDIERATHALEREFDRAGKNYEIFSQKIGVHPTLIQYWMENIQAGEKPVTTEKAAGEILAAIHGQSDFFTGPQDLTPYESRMAKGGEMKVNYYHMIPGHDVRHFEPGRKSYQIRIRDTAGGWHSTGVSYDTGTVMGQSEVMMGEYGDDGMEADEFDLVEFEYLGEE